MEGKRRKEKHREQKFKTKICGFFRFSLFDSYLDKGSDLDFPRFSFHPLHAGIMLVLLRKKNGFRGLKAAATGRPRAGGAHGLICLSVRSSFIYFFHSLPAPLFSSLLLPVNFTLISPFHPLCLTPVTSPQTPPLPH